MAKNPSGERHCESRLCGGVTAVLADVEVIGVEEAVVSAGSWQEASEREVHCSVTGSKTDIPGHIFMIECIKSF